MDAMTTALISYLIAIIISFFVAGLIWAMVGVLAKMTKEVPTEADVPIMTENLETDDAAIAAVIAIAKQY